MLRREAIHQLKIHGWKTEVKIPKVNVKCSSKGTEGKRIKYKAEKARVVRKDGGTEQKYKMKKETWSGPRKGLSPLPLLSPPLAPAVAQAPRAHRDPPTDTGSVSRPGVIPAAGDTALSKANKVLLVVWLTFYSGKWTKPESKKMGHSSNTKRAEEPGDQQRQASTATAFCTISSIYKNQSECGASACLSKS